MDRTPVRDVDLNDLPPMLERIRAVVCDDDYHLIEALATTVIETTRELRKTHATLTRVRRLFGLTGNEKTAHIKADVANPASQTVHPAVEPQDAPASDPSATPAAAANAPEPSAPPTKEKRKGHGRVPASAYRAAQHVTVDHESLRRGDSCPLCTQGRVNRFADSAITNAPKTRYVSAVASAGSSSTDVLWAYYSLRDDAAQIEPRPHRDLHRVLVSPARTPFST